jgi:hypothetical protein
VSTKTGLQVYGSRSKGQKGFRMEANLLTFKNVPY